MKDSRFSLTIFFFFFLLQSFFTTVTPYKQFSFLTGSGSYKTASPNTFASLGKNQLYFTADDGVHGFELWTSDGTEKGTHLFADLFPGSQGSYPAALSVADNQTLYFFANLFSDFHLWATKGKNPEDIVPIANTDSSGSVWAVVNDKLLYLRGTVQYGTELWYVDIDSNSGKVLKDIAPGNPGSSPDLLANNGTHALFLAADGSGSYNYWITDGTPEGTNFVVKLRDDGISFYSDAGWILGKDFIIAISRNGDNFTTLYRTNGIETDLILTLPFSGITRNWVRLQFDDKPLFVFSASTPETGQELFKSDLTAQGSGLVSDFIPGTIGSFPAMFSQVSTNNKAIVWATNQYPIVTYATDGTTEGTIPIFPPSDVGISPVSISGTIEGALIFTGESLSQPSLYRTDGTANGTYLLQANLANQLWYFNTNATLGGNRVLYPCGITVEDIQLCLTRGTPETSGLLKIINRVDAKSPQILAPIYSDLIAFDYGDITQGVLYSANGKRRSNSTRQLGDDELINLIAGKGELDGLVFFTAGGTFWKQNVLGGNSTPVALQQLTTLVPIVASYSRVFFTQNRDRFTSVIWGTDGTVQGTQELSVYGSTYSGLISLWKEDLYFYDQSFRELWKTDGSPENTQLVKVLHPDDSIVSTHLAWIPSVSLNGLFFLKLNSLNLEVWKTNGTEAGTGIVSVTSLPALGAFQYLTSGDVDGVGIFILIRLGFNETALYLHDGTSTTLVTTGWPNLNVALSPPTSYNKHFIMSLTFTNHSELWSSDGTSEGTVNISPERVTLPGKALVSALDGRTFFVAATPLEELWSTLGTKEKTKQIPNSQHPSFSTNPDNLVIQEDFLFFTGLDSNYKEQVYRKHLGPSFYQA